METKSPTKSGDFESKKSVADALNSRPDLVAE